MVDNNDIPEGLDEFLASDTQVVQPSYDPTGNTQSDGAPAGLDEFIEPELKEAKYGTIGQQALTALEGAGVGATLGLSTKLETALGVNPEDIRARAEVNPVASSLGQVSGAIGSSFTPIGAANILTKAGAAGAKALGATGIISSAAVKGALESALFQGGVELSKAFTEDPSQTAETAITDIGLAGVMGGVFGGAFGAAAAGLKRLTPGRIVSELDTPKIEAGDFRAAIEHSDDLAPAQKKGILEGLMERKVEAPEIEAAAKRLGAPVMEGMTSASSVVQKAEDSLINGAPTISGLKRQALYQEGFDRAQQALTNIVGDESRYTKAELGNIMKGSIVKQLDEQNAPIKALYDDLKQYHQVIPLSEQSGPTIARSIEKLQEFKLSPSSPEAQLAKRVINEIENLKTVDDVKAYRSILNRSVSPTASSGEKRMVGILSDKLADLEESSIERFAKAQMKTPQAKERILGLIGQRKIANKQYADFIEKVQTLSEQLGKGRVYGLQDAKNFISDLTPESVTQKLFSKNNSEFLKFFSKEFPEEMSLMREYQKGILKEQAAKSGTFSPKVFFNNVNKMEPEIRKSIFSAEELRVIKDAETYLRAFPKEFNPSGTSHMSAFREFFNHPTGALIGNARDFAIEKFIKAVSGTPELKNAAALGSSTVKGWKTVTKAIKGVFDPAKDALPSNVIPLITKREKLDRLIAESNEDPNRLYAMGDNNPVPEYSAAFAAASARAVQYLNSLRPKSDPKAPLDSKHPPSSTELASYHRALDIAQQPLITLKHLKDGTLTSQDMISLKTIYPSLYNNLASRLTSEMAAKISKGEIIPYSVKMGLSIFLGQALDSTMSPSSIQAAQPSNPQPRTPDGNMSPAPKSSKAGLDKIYQNARTPAQQSEANRIKD